MIKSIQRAGVLGAGVMGARIAAHLANAGIPTHLLDIGPGNKIVDAGLDAARKSKPAAFFHPDNAALVTTGNFDDHLSRLAECDWIIEAVAEKLEIKRNLLARVEKVRKAGSIVTTNTSGLPIASIVEGFSEDFRQRWFGTHFFNPPRYMFLLEIIPGPGTQPEAMALVSDFCDRRLGKGIVNAKDAPNFIANRIGTFSMVNILRLMEADGYTVEEVDALTGPAIGLPKTATFRLIDLVGLDTCCNVIRNLHQNAVNDEKRDWFVVPAFMEEMLKRGWIGDKAGQGFYKKTKNADGSRDTQVLDLKTMEYRPQQKPRFPVLEMTKNVDSPLERVRMMYNSSDRAGEFTRKTLSEVFTYTKNRIPEICDSMVEVDRCVKWGFGWETGLSEMAEALGLGTAAKAAPLPGVIYLKEEKERSKEVKKNAGASLIDLGDGVFCVEFHSKMNALGADIFAMMREGLKEADANGVGLVIANQGANFSVGANIILALLAAQEEEWDEIDLAIKQFQNVNMAIKCSPKPVVVAPFGMSLGGGCETPLHAARIRAAAELYMGMVEVGVGLIPGGGGCKEMVIRSQDNLQPDEDPFARLRQYFEQIGFAKVSTSAEEARRFHYLRAGDAISMNRERLVADAKEDVIEMSRDYRAALPRRDIKVTGETGRSIMMLGIHMGLRGGYMSEHDALVGRKLAHILAGGNLSGTPQVSEQYLLDLEREAFLSLLGQKKTQERMAYTLKTGKPLRN
jgi:3-hydroxyacyl-CoA dehydrogenase